MFHYREVWIIIVRVNLHTKGEHRNVVSPRKNVPKSDLSQWNGRFTRHFPIFSNSVRIQIKQKQKTSTKIMITSRTDILKSIVFCSNIAKKRFTVASEIEQISSKGVSFPPEILHVSIFCCQRRILNSLPS